MKKATIKAYEWAELSDDAKTIAEDLFTYSSLTAKQREKQLFTKEGAAIIPIEVREWYEPEEGEKFARMCNITKEGMNKGWIWAGGDYYTKNLCDTIAGLREDFSTESELSDDQLLEWAYTQDFLYYTEWEDENDFQYVFLDGELIEIEN